MSVNDNYLHPRPIQKYLVWREDVCGLSMNGYFSLKLRVMSGRTTGSDAGAA